MKSLLSIFASIFVAGCSVVGQSDVETPPYTLLKSNEAEKIEVRSYDNMVLVSTNMSKENGYSAFRTLFDYINGENEGATEITMTAPVMMNSKNIIQKGTEIPMTAPVFMNESADTPQMSFVMPKDFTLQTTPKPTNPKVRVSERKGYKVAAITFSGTLSDSNVEKHATILTKWMTKNGYFAITKPVKAGYNSPFTLPLFRKNEVLIEIR
ncbi:MAG: hypothetical protein ACI9C4_002841 [Paraglaciecola sp.]|jgi:hypothetical protein